MESSFAEDSKRESHVLPLWHWDLHSYHLIFLFLFSFVSFPGLQNKTFLNTSIHFSASSQLSGAAEAPGCA
jgi:hypothetical protein